MVVLEAIWAFMTSKIAGPLFAAGALALGVTSGVLYIQKGVLDDEINNPKNGYIVQLGTAKTNIDTLTKGLAQCNQGVQDWKKRADDNNTRANAALAQLAAQAPQITAKIAGILSAKPRAGQSRCDAADELIRNNAQ